MTNEYYGVASTPMDDYLAHYGVRGMKWGVRRALARRDAAGLGKQYKRAEKKLAKLEKKAAKTKRYASRAALMGAGAAAAGSVAAFGPGNVVRGVGKAAGSATKLVGKGVSAIGDAVKGKAGSKFRNVGNAIQSAGRNLSSSAVGAGGRLNIHGAGSQWSDAIRNAAKGTGNKTITNLADKHLKNVSNNTLVRLGAGAVGAGLAAGAARNAYKAATAKKKAERFRNEMNKAFAGTQYARSGKNTSVSSASTPKKRRRQGRNT